MNPQKHILLLILLIFTSTCFAQINEDFYYEYTYDASGNRIKRAVFEIPDVQQQVVSGDTIDDTVEEEIAMVDFFDDNINNNGDTFFYNTNELSEMTILQNHENKIEETEQQANVETKIGEFSLTVYPNPVREVLRIEIDGLFNNENAYWQLVDMQGRTIKTQTINKHTDYVMFSNIQPGTYLLVFIIGDERQEFKIIRH